MATKSVIERRLSGLEAKMKPKRIETLADWVLWLARRERYGDTGARPQLSPEMEECLSKLGRWKH
jgi:hypothetical protein